VTLDTCTSSGNQSDGLDLNQMANVSVVGPSSFDNNGEYGINLTDHAALNLFDYWGPTDISGNSVMGVLLTELSEFSSVGNLTIENNGVGPSSGQSTVVGYGIEIYGESGAQFGECFGPSIFKNNASGGISVLEDSQLSFWPCGEGHTGVIEGNGPVGITVGQGSQTTLSGEVQIRDHLGPGVDVSSNGNVFVEGSTVIENNGSANSARSAGVSLSGNSSALISGGQILSNFGPGLLVTLNSSAVFKQVAITGNVEGIIVCDNTSHMWTDLTGPPQTKSIDCTTPSIPPVFPIVPLHYAMPEMSAVRARQARYMSLAKAMVKPQ
jgi:hypothetical protein